MKISVLGSVSNILNSQKLSLIFTDTSQKTVSNTPFVTQNAIQKVEVSVKYRHLPTLLLTHSSTNPLLKFFFAKDKVSVKLELKFYDIPVLLTLRTLIIVWMYSASCFTDTFSFREVSVNGGKNFHLSLHSISQVAVGKLPLPTQEVSTWQL